jgi:hypothetical protein
MDSKSGNEATVNTLVDVALVSGGTAYALLLENLGDRRDPNLLWLEVVGGASIALLGNEARALMVPEASASKMARWGWRSFAAVGLPIVIWVLWQVARGRAEWQEARQAAWAEARREREARRGEP